ncbi:FHA domain-containing protein [Spirillospora sp. CA-108201]
MSNLAHMTRTPEGPIATVWTVGRDESCTVRPVAGSVSRKHAEVSYTAAAGWSVKDLGSTNGTVVEPKEGDPWKLAPGQQYPIGEDDTLFFGPDVSLHPRSLRWP